MKTSRQTLQVIVTLAMLASPFPLLAADTFSEAARALVDRIVAVAGPLEPFELTFRNLASLEPEQAAEAWKTVENALRSRGIQFTAKPGDTPKIRITLSENSHDYLWVAEISRGQVQEQVMVVRSRPPTEGTEDVPPRMAIRADLVMEADNPILDMAFQETSLLVLDTRQISIYRKTNDHWVLEHAATLPEFVRLPRDVRGRLSVQGDLLRVYLPGLLCSVTTRPELALDCARAESEWPLESGPAKLESGRNFFVQGELTPFFSSARTLEDSDPLWLFAGTDGRVRLYDKVFQPVGTISGWGGDIASVDSGCGIRRQILVTLPGDPSERGAVQAFEIIRRQSVAVTSPVEFAGPITALWPLSTHDGVFAATRDVRTGRYVAFHLSIACGR